MRRVFCWGPDGDLYILDLVNRNIKVLRSTDGSLWKIIRSDDVLPDDPGCPRPDDIAVDRSGVIYLLTAEGGRTRVVALDDTGRVLAEYPVPEEINPGQLMKTGKGEVVLSVGLPHAEYRLYSFKRNKFIGCYKMTISNFFGEDRYGNLYGWAQVEDVPAWAKSAGSNVKLKVLRFSKEGRLLDSLLIPQDDYFAMCHSKSFTVDEEGNIYQVLPAEDRLEVNIWSLNIC